jgi:dynein heavy chain
MTLRRSLKEADLGLKGDLTITEAMESLMNALFLKIFQKPGRN